jgi:TolB-like protein
MNKWPILLLLVNVLYAQATTWPLAVSDMLGKGLPQSQADIISDRLRGELVKTGHFIVLERSQMDEILKEQGFQQSGACTEQSCIVTMGQMLGVQYIITGTVGQVGKMMTMSLKIVRVATGEIMSTVSEDCECTIEDVLSQSTVKIAQKLDQVILSTMYSGIMVNTEPSGASVSLNGAMYGDTPFSTNALPEGNYRLQIAMAGYIAVVDSFAAVKGKNIKKIFKMEHTQAAIDSLRLVAEKDSLRKVAVQDSIRIVEKKEKFRKKIIRETIFGVISIGFAGGAMGVNVLAKRAINGKRDLIADYDNASTGFAEKKTKINESQKKINNLLLTRNILYGAAGAAGVALLITIPF